MCSDAYRNAKARRAELQKELASVNWFIAQHNNLSRGMHITMLCPTPSRRVLGTGPRGGNPSTDEVANIAERVLRISSKPIRGSDLFTQCCEHGLALSCKDPKSYFTTMLWRSRRFERTADGYAIKDMDVISETPNDLT